MAGRRIEAEVTDTILAQLRQGIRPWQSPWEKGDNKKLEGAGIPLRHNGEPYSGINVVVLWAAAAARGYAAPTWMTFNQARRHGGAVRRGEKGQMVVYADTFTKTARDPVTGEEEKKTIGFYKRFRVFNVEQIDGLDARFHRTYAEIHPINPEGRDARLDGFFADLGIDIRHGGDEAYYVLAEDYIQMPPFEVFHDAEAYYTTLAHESVHWTRHAGRLDRKFRGSYQVPYAKEELVAEIGSAFLSAQLGIAPRVRDDHADYIGAWLRVLEDDSKAIFRAASHASKAVNWLVSRARVQTRQLDLAETATTADVAVGAAPAVTPATVSWPDRGVPLGAVQGSLFRGRPENVARLLVVQGARRFAREALAFRGRMPSAGDGGAWRVDAQSLIRRAADVDLAAPGVRAAIEAEVALAAARPAEVLTAEVFLERVQKDTQRRLAMADLAETHTHQQAQGQGFRA